MDDEELSLRKSKPRHSQGSPRTGKSPNTSDSFVRARPRTGRFNARGRGRVALSHIKGPDAMIEGGMKFRSQRVIVKVRVVPMRGGKSRAAYAHLKYLQRDGTDVVREVGEDGRTTERESKGLLYSAYENEADQNEFIERGEKSFRGRGDKHQFRVIISPETGADMGDLKPFTRDLMRQMEKDLNTRLDWVAVNHYDTAHPHTHVVIRGATDDGKILNIAGDYISKGIRGRARELATQYLGHKSEWEVMQDRASEVRMERFTILDKALQALEIKGGGEVDLRPGTFETIPTLMGEGINRHLLIGRIKHLRDMSLAHEFETGKWHLRPEMPHTLTMLGERGDIIKSVHRAMKKHGIDRKAILHNEPLREEVIGRVIDKRLARDELSGRLRLTVDGVDGKVHMVEVSGTTRAGEARIGAIVRIEPHKLRQVDKTISERVDHGIYNQSAHLKDMQESMGDRAEGHIEVHVRRLKALEAAGIVQEKLTGLWQLPKDFEERALGYDRNKRRGAKVVVLSQYSLKVQLGSEGRTWLDDVQRGFKPDGWKAAGYMQGYGLEMYNAVANRQAWLIEQGLAERVGTDKLEFRKGFREMLRRREVQRVGTARAAEAGKQFKEQIPHMRIDGKYTEKLELKSGPHALIETERAFYLVPWRDAIEKYRGREITGRSSGAGGISWELGGRTRGLGR